MTNAAVNRPLNERERDFINELIVWKVRRNIAAQGVNVTVDSVVNALDDLNDRTPLHRQYDAHEVHVTTGSLDQTILSVNREWLTFHAAHDEQLTEDELERALDRGDVR